MLIVQKYGGTSVGTTERIRNVAARVAKYHANGDPIVVVASAMSGVTDNLIRLAKEIMPLPNEREMDMLLATGEQTTIALTAMALHSIGIDAVSLTGAPWIPAMRARSSTTWPRLARAWASGLRCWRSHPPHTP